MSPARALVVVLLAVLAVTGLLVITASSPERRPGSADRAAARPAPPLPAAPRTAAVLRIEGTRGGNAAGGRATEFDLAALRALPQLTLRVEEPFVRREMTLTGPRMRDVLDAARAPGGRLLVHALDDYEVVFAAADLRGDEAILALRAEGAAIPVAQGGPIRIVFGDEEPLGENLDNWIWSVDRISPAGG